MRLLRAECAGKPAARHFPLKRGKAGLPAHAEPRLQPRIERLALNGVLGLTIMVLAARMLPAQAIGQGFELERAGQYDQAAAIYLATPGPIRPTSRRCSGSSAYCRRSI